MKKLLENEEMVEVYIEDDSVLQSFLVGENRKKYAITVNIPVSKKRWIDKTMEEYYKVQEYLDTIV